MKTDDKRLNGYGNPSRKDQHMDHLIPRTMFPAFYGTLPDRSINLFMTDVTRISNGTFGVVYKAQLYSYPVKITGSTSSSSSTPQKPQLVAVKRVLQDRRFKNRELEITRILDHKNIVSLKYYFRTSHDDNHYLGLIMEYMPMTLYTLTRDNFSRGIRFSDDALRTYAYQLLSAMNYIHRQDICHRDIKPQNILVDAKNELLKVCDFGSAKRLIPKETSVAYICSRHYRAPELILGDTLYSTAIDIWACGCVLSETLIGRTLFVGQTSQDQLTQIILVIGVPDRERVRNNWPNLDHMSGIVAKGLRRVLNSNFNAFVDLIDEMVGFMPESRPSSAELLSNPMFRGLI